MSALRVANVILGAAVLVRLRSAPLGWQSPTSVALTLLLVLAAVLWLAALLRCFVLEPRPPAARAVGR